MLGLMIHTLCVSNGKSCCLGQIISFTDVVSSDAATINATNCARVELMSKFVRLLRLPAHTRIVKQLPTWQNPPCLMHDEYDKTDIWTWNKTLGSIRKLQDTDTFLQVIALAPNCCSVVVDKIGDRNGSYCVCTVLPWATADGGAQREVQVKDNLFACPSISSFLIRIVEKSTAGGKLYDHHSPTSPNSLVLHSLVQKHMATL